MTDSNNLFECKDPKLQNTQRDNKEPTNKERMQSANSVLKCSIMLENMMHRELRQKIKAIENFMVISIINPHRYSEDKKNCTICLNVFKSNEKGIILPCVHLYQRNA